MMISFLCIATSGMQAKIAVGDGITTDETFSFSIGSAIYNSTGLFVWSASGEDLSAKEDEVAKYGLAYTPFIGIDGTSSAVLTAYPYLTEKSTVTSFDGTNLTVGSLQTSPLWKKSYSSLTLLGTNVVLVDTALPRYVNYLQSVTFYDGNGTTSSNGSSVINQLDLGLNNETKLIGGIGSLSLLIAHSKGDFGTGGTDSTITFASKKTETITVGGIATVYDYLTTSVQKLIEVDTPVLIAGGDDLAGIGTPVSMFPSTSFMYVGLDVLAHAVAGQAVGLFTATAVTDPASLVFGQVLPDAVASAGLHTTVSVPTNNQVVIRNITTTTTSTGLSYLLVARNNNIENQSIYAMPMVTESTDASEYGMIAQLGGADPIADEAIVQNFKIVGSVYRTQGFAKVIDAAAEIDIRSASASVIHRILVGRSAAPVALGQYIEQLTAHGDSVYVTIKSNTGDSVPGIYKSQALFDKHGRIMAWTPWKRVAGTDDQILFSVKNRLTDSTMFVSGATSNVIEQTTWNKTTDLTNFIGSINSAMPSTSGGVQGLVSVSPTTPGFFDVGVEYSLVMATGNKSVVISQTGSVQGGDFKIDVTQPTMILSNSSNGLDIGSVVTAAFASDTSENHWLFMGGDQGLSVYSEDILGVTFNDTFAGLDVSLLATGKSCKTLGTFKFVKKIVADESYIYLMTHQCVYRIALDPDKFKLDTPTALARQVVVQSNDINTNAYFLDLLVSDGLVLLGTTTGMYSVDASTATPAAPVSIPVPQGLPSISRMVTTSAGINSHDSFKFKSNLYVLSTDFTFQQAQLNRFTITDGVIEPIQDQLFEGVNGPLIIYDYMSNNLFIDGSLGFVTSYRIGTIPPIVKYMQYTLQAGRSSRQYLLDNSTSDISIASVLNSLGVTSILRDYGSGCLMMATSFGLLTDS